MKIVKLALVKLIQQFDNDNQFGTWCIDNNNNTNESGFFGFANFDTQEGQENSSYQLNNQLSLSYAKS